MLNNVYQFKMNLLKPKTITDIVIEDIAWLVG